MRPVWNWGTSSVELLWCWNVFWNWGNLRNFWNCCEWTVVILKWSDRLLRSSEKKQAESSGGKIQKARDHFLAQNPHFLPKGCSVSHRSSIFQTPLGSLLPQLVMFFPGRYIHYSLREQQPRMFHAKSSCCKLPSPFLSCFHTWQTIRFMVLPHSTSVFWGWKTH